MAHGTLSAHETSVESGRSHNAPCEDHSSMAELRQSNVQRRTLRTSFVVDACSAIDIRGQPCRDDDHQAVHLHSLRRLLHLFHLHPLGRLLHLFHLHSLGRLSHLFHLHSFGTIVAIASFAPSVIER